MLAAGRGGGDRAASPPAASSFSVGGLVSGLSGAGLVLHNNGGDALSIPGNGVLAFPSRIQADATYAVTAAAQPSGQICTVDHGMGTGASDVNSVW